MISSIAWIPAGIANPNPRKYEMSTMEKELMQQILLEQQGEGGLLLEEEVEDSGGKVKVENQSNDNNKTKKKHLLKVNATTTTISDSLPIADASLLPPELRMDEYSDEEDADNNEIEEDDEEDDNIDSGRSQGRRNIKANMSLGTMLLGRNHNDMNDADGSDTDMDDDDDNNNNDNNDNESIDDDDDQLRDVPDTREYVPLNVEGLQAMNIGGNSHRSNNDKKKKNKTREFDEDGDEDLENDQLDAFEDDGEFDMDDEDDRSEIEDVQITGDDALILVAKTEEDYPTLEVHVYDTKLGNLYVHHDISLPSFPLCLAHGRVIQSTSTNYTTSNDDDNENENQNVQSGNYCAVGTFAPGIEIWNLDVLNALEPSMILGGYNDTSITNELLKYQILNQNNNNNNNKTKKQSPSSTSSSTFKVGSHRDAVLSLSWNTTHVQVLASGSADKTIKLWDVTTNTNVTTYQHHKNKVSTVQFHPIEATLLASGSYDRTISLIDARTSSNGDGSSTSSTENIKSIKITADCEGLAWDPFKPELLTVLSEDGIVSCYDVRKIQTNNNNGTNKKKNGNHGTVWSFVANEFGGVNDLSYNSHVPGLLATCSSTNQSVSLWDTYQQEKPNVQSNNQKEEDDPNNHPTMNNQFIPCTVKPQLLSTKNMCGGKLYSVSFYPSLPWLLGCGGTGNVLSLWDLSDSIENRTLQQRFQSRCSFIPQQQPEEEKEKIKNEKNSEFHFSSSTTKTEDAVPSSFNIKENKNKKKLNYKNQQQKKGGGGGTKKVYKR